MSGQELYTMELNHSISITAKRLLDRSMEDGIILKSCMLPSLNPVKQFMRRDMQYGVNKERISL